MHPKLFNSGVRFYDSKWWEPCNACKEVLSSNKCFCTLGRDVTLQCRKWMCIYSITELLLCVKNSTTADFVKQWKRFYWLWKDFTSWRTTFLVNFQFKNCLSVRTWGLLLLDFHSCANESGCCALGHALAFDMNFFFCRLIESSLGSVATKFNFFIHNLAQLRFSGLPSNDEPILSFSAKTYSLKQDGRIKQVSVFTYQKRYNPDKHYVSMWTLFPFTEDTVHFVATSYNLLLASSSVLNHTELIQGKLPFFSLK